MPRRDGRRYRVSPWALTCKDENYYLIAHDAAEDKIKHFRVDKMGDIQILSDVKREGNALFERFDIADYTNKTFSMFGGREETVTLLLENQLIGVDSERKPLSGKEMRRIFRRA